MRRRRRRCIAVVVRGPDLILDSPDATDAAGVIEALSLASDLRPKLASSSKAQATHRGGSIAARPASSTVLHEPESHSLPMALNRKQESSGPAAAATIESAYFAVYGADAPVATESAKIDSKGGVAAPFQAPSRATATNSSTIEFRSKISADPNAKADKSRGPPLL